MSTPQSESSAAVGRSDSNALLGNTVWCRRAVEIIGGDGILGQWAMQSPTCPMWPHQDAIRIPREQCAGGITTNGQGPVPLRWCSYANRDGNFDTPDGPHVECRMVPNAELTRGVEP